MREALDKIPFIASFGSFIDDTSAFADLILPDHSFLESWVDAQPESGSIEAVTTSAGPVMKPLYQTRATADVLLEAAGKLKKPVTLPWKTAEEVAKSVKLAAPSELRPISNQAIAQSAVTICRAVSSAGDAAQFPFHFLPYASQAFLDGSTAHLPWLQELPDPITSAMWSSWVEINPQTAERLGIGAGRSRGGHVAAWRRARAGHDLSRHRTRRHRHAGRAGSRARSRGTRAGAA